nr:PEP-CTERM sorting domain-containing protein [Duganella guangzhouensis]
MSRRNVLKTLTMLRASTTAALLFAATAQANTTIDFDAGSVQSQLNYQNWIATWTGTSYVEDGFLLQSSGPWGNQLLASEITYNNGSYAMAATPVGTTTLTSLTSPAFNLNSIDLIRLPARRDWTVTFIGTKTDNTTVSQTITITDNAWHTYSLGADFTDLVSVTWQEGVLRLYAYDNIDVTAVPEAETWAMLLAGLGMLGWMQRRRQA